MYQQSNVFLILSFLQAIELASEVLANVKFIQEKKLIGEQFCYICNLFLHSIASLHIPHGSVSLWQISIIGSTLFTQGDTSMKSLKTLASTVLVLMIP